MNYRLGENIYKPYNYQGLLSKTYKELSKLNIKKIQIENVQGRLGGAVS